MPTAEQCRAYAAEYQSLGRLIFQSNAPWGLVGGASAEEADLNANGNPAGKRLATQRNPYGIVAF